MAESKTHLRVFIASPGGLADGRKAFRDAISEINRIQATHDGFHFEAIAWEDTVAGNRRAQSVINDELRRCDYCITLLHKRWGTPPGKSDGEGNFSSGTEEEFHISRSQCLDVSHPMEDVALFFKNVPNEELLNPDKQLKQVLHFRNRCDSGHELKYRTFEDADGFSSCIRAQLAYWLQEQKGMEPTPIQDKVNLPEYGSVKHEVLDERFSGVRKLMSQGKELQAELAVAELAAQNEDPEILLQCGIFLLERKKHTEAIKVIERATRLRPGCEHNEIMASIFNILGNLRHKEGRLGDAQKSYQRASKLALEKSSLTAILTNHGLTYQLLGDHKRAKAFYRKALKIDQNESTPFALSCLASLLLEKNNLREAERNLRLATTIIRQKNQKKGLAANLRLLGIILLEKRNFRAAREMLVESVALSKAESSPIDLADAIGSLGNLYVAEKNNEEAEKCYASALAIHERLGHASGIASSHGNLGNIYFHQKKYDAAEKSHLFALDLHRYLQDKKGTCYDLMNLGTLLYERGDYPGAEESLSEALSIKEGAFMSAREKLQLFINLSDVMVQQGDIPAAKKWLKKARKQARWVDDSEWQAKIAQLQMVLKKMEA